MLAAPADAEVSEKGRRTAPRSTRLTLRGSQMERNHELILASPALTQAVGVIHIESEQSEQSRAEERLRGRSERSS